MRPGFDNQFSQMPNPGLTEKEAALIADYLLNPDMDMGMEVRRVMSRYIPNLRYRHLVYSFALGGAIALLFMGVYLKFIRKK
jgi:hypothetical protein